MQHNWYRTSWCHKIAALVIICTYFILLIFIHDTTYIWATLALVFVLFVTTFSCASHNTPFLLQLRGSRLTGITNRTIAQENNEEEQEQTETRIWMTDIPPSYSFVMADITPPTPPPSYGSAIIMFPPPYLAGDSKIEPVLVAETASAEGQQLRRPLSISTQVSVSGTAPEAECNLGGITFSTQVSVISTQSEIPPDLALRARFYISRQVSREDGTEDSSNKQENMISEASARLFLLSRQMSKEETVEDQENSIQHVGKVERLSPLVSRQISREEGPEGMDVHKPIMKHDLRRRLLLSRQASREERIASKVIQEQEHTENPERSFSRQSSVEESVENGQKKSDGRVRIVILQHNPRDPAESQNTREPDRTVEVEAPSGSTVSINIPEDLDESTKPSE